MYITPISLINNTNKNNFLNFRSKSEGSIKTPSNLCDVFEKKNKEVINITYCGFEDKPEVIYYINNVLEKYLDLVKNVKLLPRHVILSDDSPNCDIELSTLISDGTMPKKYKRLAGSLIVNDRYLNNLDNVIKENTLFLKDIQALKKDKSNNYSLIFFNKNKDIPKILYNLKRYEENSDSMSIIQKWELGDALISIINRINYASDNSRYDLLDDLYIQTPIKSILHELGHIYHNYLCSGFNSLGEQNKYNAGSMPIFVKDFISDNEKQDIVKFVSHYSATSPSEFVAEVYSGLLLGEKYPDKIMKLYYFYHGPHVSKRLEL